MIRIIADGRYYESLRRFCDKKGLHYDRYASRLKKIGDYVYEGHYIRKATPEEIERNEPLIPKPVKIKIVDNPIVKVVETPQQSKDGKRPPLLSRVETVGIGTIWYG